MRPRPLPLLAVPLLAGLLLASCSGEAPGLLRFHGTVEVQEVRVGSRVGGRVAETFAAEGAVLKAGDPVARFEVPGIEARRAGAEAAAKEAEALLEEARHGPRAEEKAQARAATEVARARLVLLKAGPREEEVRVAAADLHGAEADLERAEEALRRATDLLAASAVTRDELDAARAARDRALAGRDAAKARLDLVKAGTRPEEIEHAAAEVRRLEAASALLDAGTRPEAVAAAEARVAGARARLAEADVDLAEALVRAPEAAVLEVLSVRRGDLVLPGAPVALLHRAADLWVKVYVPETQTHRVSLGQAATVTLDGLPGKSLAGRIERIATAAEFTPRNVQSADERRHQVFGVRVRVEDAEGILKSGMAAEVVFAESGTAPGPR